MFRAGDTAGGLRDLHRFVDANPGDKAARNRIGTVVYDRARELEEQGQREQALGLYEQAVALRGEAGPGWAARIQALKKALGDDYFEKGVQAWPTDRALAIKHWETSLRYDPQNAKAAARLKDARRQRRRRPRSEAARTGGNGRPGYFVAPAAVGLPAVPNFSLIFLLQLDGAPALELRLLVVGVELQDLVPFLDREIEILALVRRPASRSYCGPARP